MKAIHLVSTWTANNRLVFGQVKTDEKSNKITATPTLLEKIAPKGCIVTIDAMGCQYKIADQIVAAEADYLFSLKSNLGPWSAETLHDDVKEYFAGLDFAKPEPETAVHTTFDVDHGRIERRYYGITGDVSWLVQRHPAWNSIKSIGVIESRREVGEKVSVEQRHYVSSLPPDPALFALAARSHWGIAPPLHYVLDMVYQEDATRIKSGNAPENRAYFRKIALSVAWSDDYFERLLFHSSFASKADSEVSSP